MSYESTIHSLALDIENRTYRPGTSNIFVVTHPKPREVIAGNLRDRIVHHFIYQYMAPYWERRFLPNSYACRPGKGPVYAGRDLRKFIRSHSARRGVPLYYLQVDVQNFFPSIDLDILYKLVARHLENPLYLWLCERVIFHRATVKGNFNLTSPKALWNMVPKYKSMFYAPANRGLPIGNLTSQFFANVYMNQLDQFIAREVQAKGRCLYWQRYVDDVLFLSDDQEALRSITPLVGAFLERELHLKLNPKKTILQPLARGLDHLGYWYKPTYQTVRRRVSNNCKARIFELAKQPAAAIDPMLVCSTLNSYFGYFRQAYSKTLREDVAARIGGTESLAAKVTVDAATTKAVPVVDPDANLKKAEAEKALQHEFTTAFTAVVEDDAAIARSVERAQRYLKSWAPMADLLEAAGEHFRDSPASHATLPPDFRARRRRPHGLTHRTL